MLFILLLGLGSIVTGNPVDFVFSFLVTISAGYLIVSVLINKRKINFALSTITITLLGATAQYVLLNTKVVLPAYSIVGYVIFFSFVFGYYVGCIGKLWMFKKSLG
jgi:hypothetical protein